MSLNTITVFRLNLGRGHFRLEKALFRLERTFIIVPEKDQAGPERPSLCQRSVPGYIKVHLKFLGFHSRLQMAHFTLNGANLRHERVQFEGRSPPEA